MGTHSSDVLRLDGTRRRGCLRCAWTGVAPWLAFLSPPCEGGARGGGPQNLRIVSVFAVRPQRRPESTCLNGRRGRAPQPFDLIDRSRQALLLRALDAYRPTPPNPPFTRGGKRGPPARPQLRAIERPSQGGGNPDRIAASASCATRRAMDRCAARARWRDENGGNVSHSLAECRAISHRHKACKGCGARRGGATKTG